MILLAAFRPAAPETNDSSTAALHTFEPRPSDAVRLSQAVLVIVNGMHLDESILKLAEANLKAGVEIVELAT